MAPFGVLFCSKKRNFFPYLQKHPYGVALFAIYFTNNKKKFDKNHKIECIFYKGNIFRELWMRCKNIVFSFILILLCAAIPSIAAEYNILVKNETTQNSGADLYVKMQYKDRGITRSTTCTKLRSYGDNKFYVKATTDAASEPKLTFYTNSTCSNRNSIGSISPLEGTDPAAENLIVTIDDIGVTLTNSPEPIEPPQTSNPGGPGDNPRPPTTTRKLIRFFTPWTNTSAILYVSGGDSVNMTSVKNYCGWFEARITPPQGSLQVYFKQTIGYDYVGDIHYTKINPATQSILLSLDSAAAKTDTIWVKAGKEVGSATTVYEKYPGILGDCPTKKLPVMMFDWLHGTKGDGDIKTSINRRDSTVTTTYANGAKDLDPDFGPMYATSDDFGSGGCAGSNSPEGNMKGMVEEYLGPNGVPVRAANFPEKCKITEHLNNWFLPQVVAQKNGKDYSNATCRSIELNLDNNGLWLGQKDNKSPEGGLFLLDDFQYLDAENTVKNPFYDNISANGKRHNYGFTMKIQATFEYVPGQYFEFFGDDDVWVFINNRLVVDIGGQHTQVLGAVDLDTLGLTEGKNYPFHIFYAERHTSQSNFMMRTSIDLKTDASLFYQGGDVNGVLDYKIYQIIREQALSCDFSGATVKDTVDAPSNFTLFGGAYSEGIALDSVGVWFGGITIKPGYTGFTIDTAQIKSKRALPPGTYQLRFSLQKDETQYDEITFVIDKYTSPPIVYALVDEKNNWTNIGNDVDGNTVTLGKWVNTRYPVNVMFDDGSVFDDIVYVTTSNPRLIPCDENGNSISAITLKKGKATFYVKATAPVQDVTLMVSSADEAQKAYWRHISFMEPPVPQVVFACIFDRNGDGRGDSVYAKLNKPMNSLNNNFVSMDSVQLEFGEKFPTIIGSPAVPGSNITSNDRDSSIAIVSPNGGFGTVPFTGGAEKIYSGKITPFWKYSEGGVPTVINLTSDVTDSVGPVITAAEISYSDDGSTILALTFSEGLDCENDIDASYFIYFFKQTNLERTDVVPEIIAKDTKAKWRLVFRSTSNDKDNIPVMGDSIRMVHGIHMDLLHRTTPANNPFVRISGEQKVIVTSPPVVTIGESDSSKAIIRNPKPTVPKIIQSDKPVTVKDLAKTYGTQGHYLGDLSLSSLVKDEVTNLVSAIKNDNAKCIELYGKTLEEILNEVQSGAISINKAKKEYKLSDELVDAYKNEIINTVDVTGIANGNSSVIEKITKTIAEKTVLEYKTQYFTSLGIFVNSNSGSLSCTDTLYNGNCLDDDKDGKIFLAWNMKSKKNRLVGTGVYIARLSYKIRVGKSTKVDRTQDFLWGVRHGKTKGFTIDLNTDE